MYVKEQGFLYVISAVTAFGYMHWLILPYELYVTGYWKTDHNVTLGQLHFIGPANSHTHALSMHHCIIGLS